MSQFKSLIRAMSAGALFALAATSSAYAVEPAKSENSDLVDQMKREEIAQQIIALGFPEKSRSEMVDRTMDAMMNQMRTSLAANNEVLEDPSVVQIMDDYMVQFRTDMQPVLAVHLPKLFEAIGHAYAQQYSASELEEILAFAKTPTGARFIGRGSDLVRDPDVAAANTAYMTAAFADMPDRSAKLRAKLETYFKSKKKKKAST